MLTLRQALEDYVPGKPIITEGGSYGFERGEEYFVGGGVRYTNVSPGRAPDNLQELKTRLLEISEAADKREVRRIFTLTIESWVAVIDQLISSRQ